MDNKFFLIDYEIYEYIRLQIDNILGYPNDFASTSIEPLDSAPKSKDDRVLLAIKYEIFNNYPISQLLLNNDIIEISDEEYNKILQDII